MRTWGRGEPPDEPRWSRAGRLGGEESIRGAGRKLELSRGDRIDSSPRAAPGRGLTSAIVNPFSLARVLAPLVVLAAITACCSPPKSEEVAFTPVLEGPVCAQSTPTQFVARSQEEWLSRWSGPALTVGEKARTPDIDWKSQMLVCVALGTRPSGGYAVHIEKIERAGAALVVHAREEKPAPGSIQTRMLTTPFSCVATARFDGEVRFDVR